MVMEYRGSGSEKTKPVVLALMLLLLLSCLLLPMASSVPLSRSVSLANRQASDSTLEVPVQGVARTAEERNMGGVAARMGIEVNDYPGSSANGRHDPPRSPGRA